MITLTAKINILSGDEKNIGVSNYDGYVNSIKNNISSDFFSVQGKKRNGKNPFIIGASKLGDGSTFSGNLDYFIGNKMSDENGNFSSPYNISISVLEAEKLKALTIAFDTVNYRHPKKIEILKETTTTTDINKTVEKTTTEYIYPNYNGYEQKNGNIILSFSSSISLANIVGNLKDGKIISCGIEYTYTSYTKDGAYETTEGNYKHSSASIKIDSNKKTATISYKINIGSGSEVYGVSSSCGLSLTYSYTETTQGSQTSLIPIGELIDDDPIYTFAIPKDLDGNNLSDFILRIADWNTPNYPLVITGVYAEVSIEIDRRNLISLSRSIFDRSDLKLPSFGIISNTGNIEFNDLDGEIRDYAEKLLLQSGLSCEVRLNNTLVDGASELIAKMESDQWDYDNDNRVVSVSIKDDLEEWQDINVPEISYDPRKVESKPFSWLYEHLWAITNANYPMQSLSDLDEQTRNVLTTTYIQYPLLESGSLWQQWTKLCQACQLHIYKNSDGLVVCRYNGGN